MNYELIGLIAGAVIYIGLVSIIFRLTSIGIDSVEAIKQSPALQEKYVETTPPRFWQFMTRVPFRLLMLTIIPGALALTLGLTQQLRSAASSSWSQAEGKVYSSRVSPNPNGDGYLFHVEYRFKVDNTPYTGFKVTVNDALSLTEAAAQALADKYPATKTVTVYYDPNRPFDPVLERGAAPTSDDKRLLILSLPLLVIGCVVTWIYLRAWRIVRVYEVAEECGSAKPLGQYSTSETHYPH